MDGVNKGAYDPLCFLNGRMFSLMVKTIIMRRSLGIDYNSNFGGWQEWDSQLSSCHQSGKLWVAGWVLAERRY